MSTSIKFCGAAGTVTGSCYLLRDADQAFLVDCGMFQGTKRVKELNYGAFPFDPSSIAFVLLTHAHIDHAGLIPKLIQDGFKGPIFATEATRDLLSFMLPDSGYIQEREVRFLNQRNRQRGRATVDPIYTRVDGVNALRRFRTVQYETWSEVGKGIRVRFWNAGHILGSASIEIEISQRDQPPLSLLFSGDIGPEHKSFHPDPEAPKDFDWVLCESTYGGVSRPSSTVQERRELFALEIDQALADDGILLIPAFAVERTQELLNDLFALQQQERIRPVQVFLDSPLAIRATEVFSAYTGDLEDVENGSLVQMPGLHLAETVEDSKAIARIGSGAIILAASGMCDAGRVRHHLKRLLWQEKATVLLVGHQARGTLGSLLEEGRKTVRIMGEDVKVRAKIKRIDLYSGHADGDELLGWLRDRMPVRRGLFLVHGESTRLEALRQNAIALGHHPDQVVIPALDEEYDLTAQRPCSDEAARKRIAETDLSKLDWHNDLAEFSIVLRSELERAPNEKKRRAILSALRQHLDEFGSGS